MKNYTGALQTLETVNDIDPENDLNKKMYNKTRKEIINLINKPYFTSLKHHHIKSPYVILMAITKYKLFPLFDIFKKWE